MRKVSPQKDPTDLALTPGDIHRALPFRNAANGILGTVLPVFSARLSAGHLALAVESNPEAVVASGRTLFATGLAREAIARMGPKLVAGEPPAEVLETIFSLARRWAEQDTLAWRALAPTAMMGREILPPGYDEDMCQLVSQEILRKLDSVVPRDGNDESGSQHGVPMQAVSTPTVLRYRRAPPH